MSIAPARPCPHPRCTQLVRGGGLCAAHRQASTARRQYSAEWARYSRAYLHAHPFCGDRDERAAPATNDSRCAATGQQTRATQTDHIQPHGGDVVRMWDVGNHQALCASCHARKTATFDGGYGR